MWWLLVLVLVACAPVVPGPAERQRLADRTDEQRIAAQLGVLPGVVRAEVMLRRPARDPLGTTAPLAASASIVVIVDDRADRAAIAASTRTLVATAVPGVEPAIVVEVGAIRPVMAKVGPFTVDASSKAPLKLALGLALAAVALFAGWLAWRLRPPVMRRRSGDRRSI